MFREMRRSKQLLTPEECKAILARRSSGVLALSGDDDYPYAVPLNYAYLEEKIIFHCAAAGHKIDAIARNPKASFCVIDADRVIPEKYTTAYRSVIIFGRIRILTDAREKREAIEKLAVKFFPDDTAEGREAEIQKYYERLCMLELSIDHMTGKEGLELLGQRGGSAD